MKRCNYHFLIILLLLLSACSLTKNAQKKSADNLEKAKSMVRQRNFEGAQFYLSKSIEEDSTNTMALLMAADLLKLFHNKDSAFSLQYKATQYEKLPVAQRQIYYQLADYYIKKGKDDKSGALLNTYLTYPGIAKEYRANAELWLRSIDWRRPNPLQKIGYSEKQLQFDGSWGNIYFPNITANGQQLIFTSIKNPHRYAQEDIYVSERQGNSWGMPSEISDRINTSDNEGACSISADGKTLILTACNRPGGEGSCDLYISTKEGNKWSKPKNLGPNINSKAWDSQPSLSADGRVLYFSSNRPGGFGKRDIYRSIKLGGEWQPAENLGATINTPEEEMAPFIHQSDQVFFFASTGRVGYGGFDIYYQYRNHTGSWSKPKNIGPDINDHRDQISFMLTTQRSAYYSVEEMKGNNQVDRIYEIDNFSVPEVSLSSVGYVEGTIFAKATHAPLKAQVQLYDTKRDTLLFEVNSDSINGEFLIMLPYPSSFALYAKKKGYVLNSANFKADSLQSKYRRDIGLGKVKAQEEISLHNIYFAFDSYKLDKRSDTEIRQIASFLKENPNIKIQVEGYADPKGSKSYNQKLSAQRAKSVYQALFQNGIDRSRMQYVGRGELQQVTGKEGASDNAVLRLVKIQIL